jgi:hypothetical protein
VLLGPQQSTGDWTSQSFTVSSSPWNIGWAYRCSGPSSGAAFKVFVFAANSGPGPTPVIDETAASGQSVTSATGTGTEQLAVVAPATCEWIVKVTGVA